MSARPRGRAFSIALGATAAHCTAYEALASYRSDEFLSLGSADSNFRSRSLSTSFAVPERGDQNVVGAARQSPGLPMTRALPAWADTRNFKLLNGSPNGICVWHELFDRVLRMPLRLGRCRQW
jgi:hypothetical protein